MSELDLTKEKIAYLKIWLGILVVTDISLFGWLISNLGTASALMMSAGVLATIVITTGVIFLHRRISSQIEYLRGL